MTNRNEPVQTPYRAAVPALLDAFQEEAGLTTADIADICHVNERQVYKWRAGNAVFSAECLIRLILWSEANDGIGYHLLIPQDVDNIAVQSAMPPNGQKEAKSEKGRKPKAGVITSPNDLARKLGVAL